MIDILFWSENGKWREADDLSLVKEALSELDCRVWVDVTEPTEDDLQKLKEIFSLHPLTIRWIRERVDDPKIDIHANYVFLILHRIFYHLQTERCDLREFEVCFSDRFIVTTHTKELSRTFEMAKEKLIEHKRECFLHGTSYVLFRLLNLCVQDYNPAIQEWQDDLEDIEQRVLKGTRDNILEKILNFKKLVANMRKKMTPERDVLREFYAIRDIPFMPLEMRPYFKVIIDNFDAVFLDLEHLRENAFSVFEVYAMMLSHQMNFVIQRLTIAATIFLPLTFIVGVYGMNFDYFPELHWKWFYFGLWGIMVSLVAGMIYFFKRKKWM